jgi:uncharacterized protein YaaQ
MQLVIAVVQDEDADRLIAAVVDGGYKVTRINTVGGFLERGNATVLVGVEDEQVEELLGLIRANCYARRRFISPLPALGEPMGYHMPAPVEVEVGGATVFVLPVERFERL